MKGVAIVKKEYKYTIVQTCKLINKKKTQVWNLISDGILKARKEAAPNGIGFYWLVSEDSINKYLANPPKGTWHKEE
jgi:hypothetical protein